MPGKATQVRPISLKIGGYNVNVAPTYIEVEGLVRKGDYKLIYGLLQIGEYNEALRILLPIVEELINEFIA